MRYVNFERVRASLTDQIASAYVRMSGIQPGPLGQQAVVVALAVADPVIRKLVSPEALSELLAVGWPVAVVQDPPPSGTLGISTATLGTAWQILAASHYGIGRFEVSAPTILPAANRFRLTFHLLSGRWQLGWHHPSSEPSKFISGCSHQSCARAQVSANSGSALTDSEVILACTITLVSAHQHFAFSPVGPGNFTPSLSQIRT
jgi:hypothetical protein